ncbi:hypothetical protein Glove_606g58 [Diversispora epigaea]|uniref:Uncharacterized protein n=1 Tax=Diversispora epigaea TaxID=1348612 RepID=A0A397GF74_9GLOM|nr:hypothetical protein Glove_606g58 [Diversispora epigaea]
MSIDLEEKLGKFWRSLKNANIVDGFFQLTDTFPNEWDGKKGWSNLDNELVENLYLKWGGISQLILEKAEDSTQQQHLDDAIAKSDSRLLNFVGEIDHNISYMLIRIYQIISSKGECRATRGKMFEQITYQILQGKKNFKNRSLESDSTIFS